MAETVDHAPDPILAAQAAIDGAVRGLAGAGEDRPIAWAERDRRANLLQAIVRHWVGPVTEDIRSMDSDTYEVYDPDDDRWNAAEIMLDFSAWCDPSKPARAKLARALLHQALVELVEPIDLCSAQSDFSEDRVPETYKADARAAQRRVKRAMTTWFDELDFTEATA